ncbi:ABC transporter ATP-binding protein [Pseudooceanicola sediminis]|uniref:ABC transporter ATP-binding protein n=1 Tax=Pseudooceanicola sediminis TaxID=2211117 RepID=A0A399J3D3_9RHOB|nr:ABC transporter ATP-binding protein [Pseudooceanicola sediminis]KAA2314213.1 ABC transporter ATP-binding protein [Puniceibacterium sp. HSS470]RII39928.1 ABC transporter ATP-binding protein [Pseudooceanicola sediminis]|tara:strand:+ start:94243 stop:94932 length:690 start_codon:yes stop_codon:yes gene_type:complete
MLEVTGLEAAYGESRVLFGIDLHVAAGEVVTLMGRNGMGKTTTVHSIFGLLRPRAGRVAINGVDLTGASPHRIARAGLGLVPEGRQIFPTLSVEENLIATARGNGPWDLAAIWALFPRLRDRRRNMGDQLSGGEQQMLAIGRALMTNPSLMVLDEATEGLAPLIRAEIWACLGRIRDQGAAILVIDKNVDAMARLADRHVVIEKGRVVWSGTSADLLGDARVKENWLQV